MHYKNGKEAKDGDLVIGRGGWTGAPLITGMIVDIFPGSGSCNATIIRPGGIIQTCVNVSDYYHAEDAYAAIAATAPAPAQAVVAAPKEPEPPKAEPEPVKPARAPSGPISDPAD